MATNPFDEFQPATPANPFDEFEQVGPTQQQVLHSAVKVNPDQAARAAQLAKQYPAPVDVLARNLQDVELQAAVEKADATLKTSPKLARALVDKTWLAQQSHDDFPPLVTIEKKMAERADRTAMGTLGDVGVVALKSAVGLPQAFVGLADIVTGGYAGKGAEAIGVRFEDAQRFLDTLYSPAQQQANDAVREAEGFINSLGAMLANPSTIATTVGESSAQMLGGAAIGRGLLAAAPKLAPWLAAAFGEGLMGAGATAEQLRVESDEGLLSAKTTLAALGSGAGTALFGAVGGRAAQRLGLGDIDTVLTARGVDSATAQTLQRGFIARITGAGISEGVFEELPQSVQEQLWQNWATDKPLGQGVGKAAAQGLLAGLSMGGGFQAVSEAGATLQRTLLEREAAVDRAQAEGQRLTEALQAAAQSKLRERNPETFRDLAANLTDNATVFVDAQVLAQSAAELAQALPAVAEQLEAAIATNSTIEIPVADILTLAPGTPLEQVFLQNARQSPDAMSLADVTQAGEQAQQFLQQEAERVMQQAQDQQAWQASSEAVKTTILDQLNQAGRFSADVNEAYATLQMNFFSTMAARLGTTPQELYDRYSLKVAQQTPGQGNVLNAGGALNDVKQAWADAGIDGDVFESRGRILLSKIVVPKDQRSTGIGSKAMQQLLEYADRTGQRVELTPASDFGGNKKRLVEFYKRFGFVENKGKNKDYEVSEAMYRPAQALNQSATLRRGTETLKKYGLKPGQKYKTREVAAALEARQRAKYGAIAADDRSPEALAKIAKWMQAEVEFAMDNPESSGVGWYSEKFQRALDTMAQVFPELAEDKVARDTMTALIAITSDGQKVVPNFAQAMDIYGRFRTGGATEGKFTTTRGHQRQASIDNNLAVLQRLYDQMGADGMHEYLMQEKTISELKKLAKANGGDLKSDYQAHIKMPMAAVEFGPKLGAFYANLMGAHGYLTMDRWWSRTFNRYRGTLLQAPTRQGLDRFKELLGNPAMSDDEAVAATVEPRNAYEAKGFKNGTEIEKAANTIWKAAFDALEDSPFNATDRTFMLDAVNKAQQSLARKGYNLSVADIQAILWYYEKRLYGELGARQTADISYEEAAQRVVAGYARGSGIESVLDDTGAAREDGGADAVRVPVGEEQFDEGNDGVLNQGAYTAATIDVDGKARPTTNANGQPIAQTEEALRNFWRWFGDSRVVDAEGKPLVVYHVSRNGSPEVFKTKGNTASGFKLDAAFFASDRLYAEEYAKVVGASQYDIGEFYLASENPLVRQMSPREFSDPPVEAKVIGQARAGGNDAVQFLGDQEYGEAFWAVFNPEQIKSATDNTGAFDPTNPSILAQGPRGTFNPQTLLLTLNENADLSTFLHESGHFFLEVMADLASPPGAPQQIVDDMAATLKWFGVPDLATWNGYTLDQKRPYHEKWAESFEQYLFEGRAPSTELQPLFRRFRSWMVNVYKTLTQFMRGRDLKLGDDIRQVFDRLIATDEQIAQAEQAAGLLPDFDATNEAIEKLQARSLRDLKWAINARNKTIKALQKEAENLRREARKDARDEVLAHPLYAAYRFLTARLSKTDREFIKPVPAPKSVDGPVDESIDSLFVAIAKLGGLKRDEVESQWGWDKKERTPTPLFGKPLLRREGGLSIDAMAQRLAEYGYLAVDEDGAFDPADFEAAFDSEYRGAPVYAYGFDYSRAQEEPRPGEGATLATVGASRLDLTALRQLDVPDAVIAKLTERGMTAENGMHPDIVADMFEFDSGAELARYLADALPLSEEIEGTADRLMLERHGDLVDQRAIEEAANEAVHNEARARSLATELKAQADMMNPRQDTGRTDTRGRPITVNAITAAAKEFAANLAARRRIKDLKNAAWQHRSAEARAGKAWQEATAKGDTQAAVQAKRDQVLNNAAAKALQDAQAETRKILEFFKRVAKGNDEKVVKGGRDPDVVNAMRAILGAYDIAPRLEKAALEYMETVSRNDPAMYAALQPSVQDAINNAKPLPEMTMEELRGLNDELRAMWALAKRSRQMEIDGNLLDRQDLADELLARMNDIGIPAEIPGERAAITDREEAGIKLQFAKSILSRVEQWAERMDGKFGGPFLRFVFQPIKEAADAYRTARVDYRKRFTALVENVAPAIRPGSIPASELGYTFGNSRDSGQAELLHAILHTGNDSNKRKLLLGRGWATENPDGTLDTSRWDAFIQRMQDTGVLRKEHYDFAQGVWDLLEEMKPLAQETHRNVFGRYFAEVTANAFETPFGSYRGGYVPAQTDALLVRDAKLRELAEGENETMAYAFPSAPSGFTKARVEYNKPLLLDLRALAQHIDKVLLFSYMQGPVTDVRRLLTDKGVAYALDRIDPGAYEGMLIPWLNRSARQIVETPVAGDRKLSRFLSAARSRAGMALMFANLSNTFQQITGFSMAAVKVKPSLMLKATAEFTRSPKAMKTSVAAASEFMRNRMLNEIGAMNDAVEQILVDATKLEKAQAWTREHAYFLQAAVDNTMSPIIWTAAYNQAIEQQMNHKDAVRFADGVIRQTQGTTLPEDISRFESGSAIARTFTQFVGYFNMMANTNATAAKQVIDEVGLRKGAGRLLGIALAGLLVPIWVAEAIAQAFRGGPDDEDDDGYLDDWLMAVFGLGTLRGMVAQVPIVGQMAQLAVNRFNSNPADDKFSLSPAVSLIESAVSSPASVYKAIVDEGSAQKAVRDVAAAATLITGLPIYGAARPIGYLAGVADERIEPTGPIDFTRGLVTGTASPESKQP